MRYSDELPVDVEPYDSQLGADPRVRRVEATNFLWLAAHQVLLRVGWIFKTESVVMPAFMSYIGGGPVMLGWLMVLNRIGFSVPPVLFSRRLKVAPRKKWLFAACGLGMSAAFAALAVLWFSGWWRDSAGVAHRWMPWAFLAFYGIFFALTGMNQLAANTLQGKVVRTTRRGRLSMVSIVVGTPLAIAAAWLLMPAWLENPEFGFGAIFACPAIAFAIAGLVVLLLDEEPDDFQQTSSPGWEYFHHAWQAIVDDTNCRALAILAVLFSMTFMLFPHYEAAVMDKGQHDFGQLTLWVCVQNAGTAVFSLVAGPLADRYGNRRALQLTMAGAALPPLTAMAMVLGPEGWRSDYGWLLFIPIGFTPVTIRLLMNYALEIAPRQDHPKYVSALGLCLAVPVIIGAPAVGLVAEHLGYAAIFAGGFLMLAAAVVQTYRIVEPRQAS